jgi:hypothetical protein
VPNQRRPLHAHPVHDPCSREGDGWDYAGCLGAGDKIGEVFFDTNKIKGLAQMYIHAIVSKAEEDALSGLLHSSLLFRDEGVGAPHFPGFATMDIC